MRRSSVARPVPASAFVLPLLVALLASTLPDPVYSLSSNRSLLVVGLGRVGLQVVNQLHTAQHESTEQLSFDSIFATARTEQDTVFSIHYIPFHPTQISDVLPKCTHVLVTVPPVAFGQHFPLQTFVDRCRNCVSLQWIGILSTTGVYGDHQGAWVTEDSVCHCSPTAMPYLQYEHAWRELAASPTETTINIFRCAGIYGSTRSALHTLLKSGSQALHQAYRANENGLTNRIHETDLAASAIASMSFQPNESFRIYNLSDDLPQTRLKVMQYAKDLLLTEQISIPNTGNDKNNSVDQTAASSVRRRRRRQQEEKRVSNQRMRAELRTVLTYPTYKEGLQAILQENKHQWKSRPNEQNGM